MLLFVIPLALAAVLNVILRRPALSIALLTWRFAAVPALCLSGQVAAMYLTEPGGVRRALVVGSQAVITGWLGYHAWRFRGQARVGLGLLALGAIMNLVPIVEYGSMPVSRSALAELGAPVSLDVAEGQLGKHVAFDGEGATWFLGDILPVAPLRSIISLGDIAMAVGLALAALTPLVALGGTRRLRLPARSASVLHS